MTTVHGSFPVTEGFTVDPLTDAQAQLMELACQLRRDVLRPGVLVRGVGAGVTVGGIRFIDPLWDPTPEQRRTGLHSPYSAHQAQQIADAAASVAKSAQAVAQHAAAVAAHAAQNNQK